MVTNSNVSLTSLINDADGIGIVAHDAGGANMLNALLRKFIDLNFYLFIDGPALKIFDSKNIFLITDEEVFFEKVNFVLAGTGSTRFEKKLLRKARSIGCETAVILDHFVNYKARFVDEGEVVFPDYCFVCDDFSRNLALKELTPYKSIHMCENYLASDMRVQIEASRTENPKNVLYVLEDLKEYWNEDLLPWEVGFRNFYENFYMQSALAQIIVRPHPKDDVNIYRQLQEYKEVIFDYSASPIDALSRVSTVVGLESYLLYLAHFCGMDVYTSLPSAVREPRIPKFCYKVIS